MPKTAPIITFRIPPVSEESSEELACDVKHRSYIQAVCEQFVTFFLNFSVRKIGIVWFCDRTLQESLCSSWLSAIIEIFQELFLWAEKRGIDLSLIATDYHLWVDMQELLEHIATYETESAALRHCEECIETIGGSEESDRTLRHLTKNPTLLRSEEIWKRAEEKKIIHPYSEVYGDLLAYDAEDFPANITEKACEWASQRACPEFLEKVKSSYSKALNAKCPPSAAAWNNALQKMSQELAEHGDMEQAVAHAAADARRSGLLLAQLSWQRARDRVILYAVHPQLHSISRLSQQQIVTLMGEASERAPDVLKAQSVLAILAYLAAFSPQHCASPYGVMAYIQWWIGEGSNALKSVETAQSRDDQCSMARLVDYAVRVQLPPPWVEVGDGE